VGTVRLVAGRALPSRGDDEAIFLLWKARHFFRQKMNEKPFQIDDPTTRQFLCALIVLLPKRGNGTEY
jgi:hypothetical protein